jgi:hypothetical protein
MRVNSYYPTLEIVEKTDQLEQVRFSISENSRRSKSVTHLRPKSSNTYRSKFYRSKVNKFDLEGNNTQEQLVKYFQVESNANFRP